MKKIFVISFLLLMGVWSVAAEWKCIKSKNFSVFYKESMADDAQKAINYMEAYRTRVMKLTGTKELERVNIVLEDTAMNFNGYADASGSIHLFTYNPAGFGDEDWMETVAVHELIHYSHFNNFGETNKILGNLFGKTLFMPNTFLFSWIMEGMTVYGESTLISNYNGRLNDGVFDGYITAVAKENKFEQIQNISYSNKYPDGKNYIYGGKFFEYLAKTYGREKLGELMTKYGESLFGFVSLVLPEDGIDNYAKKVFGKGLPVLWREWTEYEKQNAAGYILDGKKIAKVMNGNINDIKIIDGRLYFSSARTEIKGINTKFRINQITSKDFISGIEKVILSEKNEILDFDIKKNEIYYLTYDIAGGYENKASSGFGLITRLIRKNMETGDTVILDEGIIRSFCIKQDGEIIVAKDKNGGYGTTVWGIITGKERKIIIDTDMLISDMKEKGNVVIVEGKKKKELSGIFEINPIKKEIKTIVNTKFSEEMPEINGEKLFFTANYEGQKHIYSYNFDSKKIYKETNGWFETMPVYDAKANKIFYAGIESDGAILVEKEKNGGRELIISDSGEEKEKLKTANIETTAGSYVDNLATLFPDYYMPVIDMSSGIYGYKIFGNDAIGDFDYSAALLYDTNSKKTGGNISVGTTILDPLYLSIGGGNFKEGLLGNSPADPYFAAGYSLPLLTPELRNDGTVYISDYGNEKSYSEGISFYNTGTWYSQYIRLKYDFERKSMGSNEDKLGYSCSGQWKINAPLGYLKYFAKVSDYSEYTTSYSENKTSDIFPLIRGYSESINTKRWLRQSLDFGYLLSNESFGLWNPNIVMSGVESRLFGELLIDGSNYGNILMDYSGGVELSTKVNGIIEFGARGSINKNNETLAEIIFKVSGM